MPFAAVKDATEGNEVLVRAEDEGTVEEVEQLQREEGLEDEAVAASSEGKAVALFRLGVSPPGHFYRSVEPAVAIVVYDGEPQLLVHCRHNQRVHHLVAEEDILLRIKRSARIEDRVIRPFLVVRPLINASARSTRQLLPKDYARKRVHDEIDPENSRRRDRTVFEAQRPAEYVER